MMENGTGCSIVVRHNTEAFAKRCFVVPGGHSLVQIVDKYQVGIMQGPCFLHYTDTPVEIGGKAVLQVIRFYHCMSCKKSLMTYEHSLFETPERKGGACAGSGGPYLQSRFHRTARPAVRFR